MKYTLVFIGIWPKKKKLIHNNEILNNEFQTQLLDN